MRGRNAAGSPKQKPTLAISQKLNSRATLRNSKRMTIVLSRDAGVAAVGGIVAGGGGVIGATAGLPLTCSSTHRARGVPFGAGGGGNGGGIRYGGGNSRCRRAANSVAGAGSSTLGGHPLAGADPAFTKRDIKHRFEITAKLGSGTYGKVSLAYDHKTEREVAVKLIKKSAIENKQDLVRIRREIRIMSMLNHPNIIQIYEVFENKDKIILVMEYANGGELYDYVSKNGSLAEAESRRIFRQITSAVLYCHKNKVAHRDLKLENILLDSRNNAKIADFGLSNYFGQRHKLLNTFCGSPLYASPEIINGTPYKGPEVDCWSLGILLYTLVYGSMPFDGRDFNRMVRQIKRGAYYEPDTPSTASMLIRNMLRVNPDRRATIYDIASHWWLNLEENMPIIQELPENQITDPTPLNERAEIMVVQELADETDVFMEFGHLSQATRRKIEEFRRRRKEAEEYNEQSPIKPPKARRTSKAEEEMSTDEKMLRGKAPAKEPAKPTEAETEKNAFHDPLERLKQLENRLQSGAKRTSPMPTEDKKTEEKQKEGAEKEEANKAEKENNEKQQQKEKPTKRKTSLKRQETMEKREKEQQQRPAEKSAKMDITPTAQKEQKSTVPKPQTVTMAAAVGAGSTTVPTSAATAAPTPATAIIGPAMDPQRYWRLETDSLNALMNQVLEQMERGPVSINLIARIKAHPFYDERPEVKELLESIIAAQPDEVQKQTSKLIQQQSKQICNKALTETPTRKMSQREFPRVDSKKRQGEKVERAATSKATVAENSRNTVIVQPLETVPPKVTPAEQRKAQFRRRKEERRWHSVEVGFSTDSSSTEEASVAAPNVAAEEAAAAAVAAANVAKTAAMPNIKKASVVAVAPQMAAPRFVGTARVSRSEPYRDEYDEEDEEEEEDYEEDEEFYEAEEDEEEYESEIDELAEEMEQVAGAEQTPASPGGPGKTRGKAAAAAEERRGSTTNAQRKPSAPKIVESAATDAAPPNSPPAVQNAQQLNTLERGLAKRVSKGKYQFVSHQNIAEYGRGVSAEAESPPPTKRRIGGPQPRPEHSPILFDKAKDYLMRYPDTGDEEAENATQEELLISKKKKSKEEQEQQQQQKDGNAWLKSQDPDLPASLSEVENSSSSVIGARRKAEDDAAESEEMGESGQQEEKKLISRGEESAQKREGGRRKKTKSTTTEEEESEEEEEEEESATPFRPRPSTIIGFRTIQPMGTDGVCKEAPIVQVKPQTSQPQSPAAHSPPAQPTTQQRAKLLTTRNSVSPSPMLSTVVASPPSPLFGTVGAAAPVSPSPVGGAATARGGGMATHAATTPHADAPSPAPPPDPAASPPQPQRFETAAAYIRRKNRERRTRNLTVAVTELCPVRQDEWTTRFPSVDQPDYQPTSPGGGLANRRKGSVGGQKLDAQTSPGLGYQRPSYLDERKYGGGESNFPRQNYVDRRKSFHEMSPPSGDEPPYDRYAIAGGYFNSLVGNTHVPNNISRFEDEVYNAFKQFGGGHGAWNRGQEKERFEVYKTMAERSAEFGRSDIQNRMSAGGSCYYPGERPLSTYAGGTTNLAQLRQPRIVDDGYGNGAGGTGAALPYDRRRSVYETDRNGNNDFSGGAFFSQHHAPLPEPDSPPGGAGGRYRRRIGATLRDADGRRAAYASRSQSNDHLCMLPRTYDEYDSSGAPAYYDQGHNNSNNSRYMAYDTGAMGGGYGGGAMGPSDYAYVSYHDTGANGQNRPVLGAIGRQEPMDMGATPTRSILKNKQAYELEPRAQIQSPSLGTGGQTQAGLMGRLRRLASVEKCYGLGTASVGGIDDFPLTGGGGGGAFGGVDPYNYNHNHHYQQQQRFGFTSPSSHHCPRRYGGSSDHLASSGGTAMMPPSYQQQQSVPPMGHYGGGGTYFHHSSLDAADYDPYGVDTAAAAVKKRSLGGGGGTAGFLNLARRRTTEVRLQPEGGVGGVAAGQSGAKTRDTNALLDEEFKRPRSPIDRIKSLFRGNSKHRDTQAATGSQAVPSSSACPPSTRFSSAIGGGGGMPSSAYGAIGSSAIGGTYVSGIGAPSAAGYYKRYGAGTTVGGTGGAYASSNYGTNRYSNGGSTAGASYGRPNGAMGRNWYDTDTHL
ncbi:hypothetical protein niasHS_006535 [Heterodera schachtii]|uniref:Protein kinase domain-containing protein n=1 Tax=Heterodera schachtii TaxID=97005 RepID=A0ABD2JHY5_HETSC